MPRPFLTAEWRWLVMLNYEIDPAVLMPFVPMGTELDHWQGRNFVTMVGFMFLNTRIMGFHVPFYSDFEEVNLRFYVKRRAPDGWRRGVVFIKELVPRHFIAWTARAFYNENYIALPMSHAWETDSAGTVRGASYHWDFNHKKCRLEIRAQGEGTDVHAGSCEEFITEHYWGYARQRDGGTVEYQVEHPRWRVWPACEATFNCNIEGLYGKTFADFLNPPPASAFLVDGSPVTVFMGTQLALQ